MPGNVLEYHTSLTAAECVQQIMQLPWEYDCKWGTPLWYEAIYISDSQLQITFKGGQFRKAVRTQYLVDFVQQKNTTKIIMRFETDLFALPAMTPPADIDLFMGQKVNAVRETAETSKSSKPSKLLTGLCICLWVLLFGFGLFIVCSPASSAESIPLVDGLSFGMTPKVTAQLFGEACEVQPNAGDTGKAMYIYESEVLGHLARITCFFTQEDELTEVHFLWVHCASDVYDSAYACLYEHYSAQRNFFEKTEANHSVSLGTDNGATGLFYHIYQDNTSIIITCQRLS